MPSNIKYIIDHSEGRLGKREQRKFEKELHMDEKLFQQNIAFNQFNKYMRAKSDLEDVRNDNALDEIEPHIKAILLDYNTKKEKYLNYRKFVKDSLDESSGSDRSLAEEIEQIKDEIDEHEIDQIAEKWVSEWNERKHDDEITDEETRGMKDFIKESLQDEFKNSGKAAEIRGSSSRKGVHTIRISLLAAAAVIASLFVLKVLIPSNNPDKLYNSFYEPMSAFSPVTRNINADLIPQFSEAVTMYKDGEYQAAASGFSDLIQQDSSSPVIQFFAGLTQMEAGNYSRASVLLSGVTEHSSDYQTDARWYLGLSFMKMGERAQAISCFEVLAESEGFYQKKARNLLRRLK